MHRPAAPVRPAALSRLAVMEREIPEWESWTGSLRVLAQSIGDPVWRDAVRNPTDAERWQPQLEAQSIHVPRQAMIDLVQALLDVALSPASPHSPNKLHPDRILPLVHASTALDAGAIDIAAESLGIRPPALATVLHTATIPPFNACAEQLRKRVAAHWPHGFCPVCGEWPVLAELIGLDRSRRLRCSRCGTGWSMPQLVCVFCQETDHAQLGSLVPGSGSQGHAIETCGTCRGYLKTIAVLTSGSHLDVLVADLETVALDVVAQGEGLVRPAESGHDIRVRLVFGKSAQ